MMKKISFLDSKLWLTLIAILVGFLFGTIIMLIGHLSPIVVYEKMFSALFGSPKYMLVQLVYCAPLIFTGLSVTFAYKTGVFNIGAEGQFVVGEIAAMVLGIVLKLPPVIHSIVCILGAAFAGFLWAGFVALIKIKRNVNEILAFIMLNWIAFYLSNYIINLPYLHHPACDSSKNIEKTALIVVSDKIAALVDCEMANCGFLIAVVAAVVIYVILQKTTLGYALKAVGYNQSAAIYAGIDAGKSTIVSIGVAGALAGIGGAIEVLGICGKIPQFSMQEGFGFDGITVALIGCTNPLGCILSGLFYSSMKYIGRRISLVGAPKEIISLIMGCVVLFIAISEIFVFFRKKGAQENG